MNTQKKLLIKLLQTAHGAPAPLVSSYIAPHTQYTIAIGADHHATVTIDDDALVELNKIAGLSPSDCARAVETWGEPSQIIQAMEECAELITVLSHYMRGRTSPDCVASEIADVEIMCEQLRLIFGSDDVNICIDSKLARLRRMLDKHDQQQGDPKTC